MSPWLHVVGIGPDGPSGLKPAVRALLGSAEVLVGGARHLALIDNPQAERLEWPSPFDDLLEALKARRGRRVVVLATGDPLWYSVGARLGRRLGVEEIVYHPHVGAFQLAAARLGWSLADVETLTVHGRPAEQMIPWIQPAQRLLILTTGAETPARIARFLTERGFGASPMVVFSDMDGPGEQRFDGIAESWSAEVPDFNTLAVECVAGPDAQVLPRCPGLPDSAFRHDGTMTKQEVRALTLARLMPMRGALLWDVGAGCGSVAIEWMRAARDARAIGIEPRADRRALAAENALRLGVPGLRLIEGTAPKALAGLPAPDAVFLGGGLDAGTVDSCWQALKPLGRLVANAVTLESAALLSRLHAERGGDLVRLSVERAAPLGGGAGFRPLRGVTQWSILKR